MSRFDGEKSLTTKDTEDHEGLFLQIPFSSGSVAKTLVGRGLWAANGCGDD